MRTLNSASGPYARWPLVAATLVFLAACAVNLTLSLNRNGHFVYALDDPYIHMAMAKNVVAHGVWGIGASHFTSSSSSILWTTGLSGLFFLLGIREIIPFAANVLLAVALLIVVFRRLSQSDHPLPPWHTFAVLVAIIFAAPLPALTFAGLEHILHALLTVAFVSAAASWLARSDGDRWDRTTSVQLCVLSALLPVVRYEALFAVFIVSALAAVRGRWRHAAAVLVSACVPIGIYGGISAFFGWYWLPNSVLLKGSRPDVSSLGRLLEALGYISYSRLINLPALAFLLYAAIAAFIFRLRRRGYDTTQWMIVIFVPLMLLHMQFAQPRQFWFFRYEAYLVVLGLFVLAHAAGDWLDEVRSHSWPRQTLVALEMAAVLLIVVSPLGDRAARSLAILPQATSNIYEQQYQMGLFLRKFYNGSAVALNDIGAPSFLADFECFDLVGLANLEIAKRQLGKWYIYEDDIEELADASGVRIAIVYDSWFLGRLPMAWKKAGTWTISNNVVVGDNTVSFYATQPTELVPLRSKLLEFSRELPATVAWRIE